MTDQAVQVIITVVIGQEKRELNKGGRGHQNSVSEHFFQFGKLHY